MQDVCRQRTYVVSFIQALDSFGKPGAGILAGNVNWLGHFDECTSLDGFQYCSIIFNVSQLQSVGSVSVYIFFSVRCTFPPTGAHFYQRHRGQLPLPRIVSMTDKTTAVDLPSNCLRRLLNNCFEYLAPEVCFNC